MSFLTKKQAMIENAKAGKVDIRLTQIEAAHLLEILGDPPFRTLAFDIRKKAHAAYQRATQPAERLNPQVHSGLAAVMAKSP